MKSIKDIARNLLCYLLCPFMAFYLEWKKDEIEAEERFWSDENGDERI